MNKFIILLFGLTLFCISCKSIKVKEIPLMETTQPFCGKIEKIERVNVNFPTDGSYRKDTIRANGTMFFDASNKVERIIEKYGKKDSETTFQYDRFSKSRIMKIGETIHKTIYIYDKKKNIIEEKAFNGDKLYYTRKMKYDSKGNPIEILFLNNNSDRIETRKYDYRARTAIIKETDNKTNQDVFLKVYFDSKGNIIKKSSTSLDENSSFSPDVEYFYDDKGNMLQKNLVGPSGKAYDVTTYKSVFDKKGNILLREAFWNSKLIEKTEYRITYKTEK